MNMLCKILLLSFLFSISVTIPIKKRQELIHDDHDDYHHHSHSVEEDSHSHSHEDEDEEPIDIIHLKDIKEIQTNSEVDLKEKDIKMAQHRYQHDAVESVGEDETFDSLESIPLKPNPIIEDFLTAKQKESITSSNIHWPAIPQGAPITNTELLKTQDPRTLLKYSWRCDITENKCSGSAIHCVQLWMFNYFTLPDGDVIRIDQLPYRVPGGKIRIIMESNLEYYKALKTANKDGGMVYWDRFNTLLEFQALDTIGRGEKSVDLYPQILRYSSLVLAKGKALGVPYDMYCIEDAMKNLKPGRAYKITWKEDNRAVTTTTMFQ